MRHAGNDAVAMSDGTNKEEKSSSSASLAPPPTRPASNGSNTLTDNKADNDQMGGANTNASTSNGRDKKVEISSEVRRYSDHNLSVHSLDSQEVASQEEEEKNDDSGDGDSTSAASAGEDSGAKESGADSPTREEVPKRGLEQTPKRPNRNNNSIPTSSSETAKDDSTGTTSTVADSNVSSNNGTTTSSGVIRHRVFRTELDEARLLAIISTKMMRIRTLVPEKEKKKKKKTVVNDSAVRHGEGPCECCNCDQQ